MNQPDQEIRQALLSNLLGRYIRDSLYEEIICALKTGVHPDELITEMERFLTDLKAVSRNNHTDFANAFETQVF